MQVQAGTEREDNEDPATRGISKPRWLASTRQMQNPILDRLQKHLRVLPAAGPSRADTPRHIALPSHLLRPGPMLVLLAIVTISWSQPRKEQHSHFIRTLLLETLALVVIHMLSLRDRDAPHDLPRLAFVSQLCI